MFNIADYILVIGYYSNRTDHERMLWGVLQICRKENLKRNKDKCHFRCTSVPTFGEIISRHGMKPDLGKAEGTH